MAVFDSADLSDPLSSAWQAAPEKTKMAKVTKWPDDLSKMELEEDKEPLPDTLPGEPLASPPEAVPVEEVKHVAMDFGVNPATVEAKAEPEPKSEPINREVLDRWSFKRTKLFTLLHQVNLVLHPGRYRFVDNGGPVTQEHLDKAKEAQQ